MTTAPCKRASYTSYPILSIKLGPNRPRELQLKTSRKMFSWINSKSILQLVLYGPRIQKSTSTLKTKVRQDCPRVNWRVSSKSWQTEATGSQEDAFPRLQMQIAFNLAKRKMALIKSWTWKTIEKLHKKRNSSVLTVCRTSCSQSGTWISRCRMAGPQPQWTIERKTIIDLWIFPL